MMTYGTPEWREWVLDEDASRPFIKKALEMGINFFDTANAYSLGVSEEITGRAIKEFARRDEVVIATKVFFPMGEKPNQGGLSHDLVKSGKVRYIGGSSMYAWQFSKSLYLADLHGWTRFVSMQNHYNLVYREEEREMMPLCRSEGIGVIPWSPLARGFLSGNRSREEWGETSRAKTDDFAHDMYYQESDFTVVERVIELAKQKGVSPSQIALAWLLHQPGVTSPIIGASQMSHLEENVAALDIELSPEDLESLEEPYTPHPVLGHS
jgi:aryl-alcohol dehydrogenase (NADP+)